MKQKYFLIPLALGIILGPVYILVVGHFSGEKIVEQRIWGDSRFAVGNHSLAASRKQSQSSSMRIFLSPEMNPIRFSFPAQYISRAVIKREKYSRFLAELTFDSQVIWQKTLSINEKPRKKESSSSFGQARNNRAAAGDTTFHVEKAGDYQLAITPSSLQQVNISDLSVSVRRNVTHPNMFIWLPGVLLVLVGVAGFYYFGRKQS
ncbi:hypothetical protein FLL45_12165 [Aliikangiella marina]|uniref:Uncharacterized protein n=1 Tax=Aliikangiella marina TaxID=1712262 RepID=A0A545T8S9_9GAMM|nr:hypothetical protein [Aliikangiella marina]TQV73622.1 hypothetical protein FLL45_12165 [Aliikangiella marina]